VVINCTIFLVYCIWVSPACPYIFLPRIVLRCCSNLGIWAQVSPRAHQCIGKGRVIPITNQVPTIRCTNQCRSVAPITISVGRVHQSTLFQLFHVKTTTIILTTLWFVKAKLAYFWKGRILLFLPLKAIQNLPIHTCTNNSVP